MMRGVRLSLMLAAAGTIIATGAKAQTNRPAQLPPGAVVQPLPGDDGAELRRHLTTLADNPRSLEALIGAGRAALQGGDIQAALTFFSRAAEVAPRDPRVKAGMGSVLVRMERGQPAINLFTEAVALGAPVVEIAGDRGLAYDMIGNPRRAQQDYALVLQRREEPEIRRRLALSLAISGERDAALRVIDAQLRRNERAAWRTQAFILALTGDSAGASRTAQGMMPGPAAEAMAPFFARLSALSPAQKAMAAHFGRFPNDGRTAAASAGDIRADPGALALANGGQPAATTLRPRSQPADTAARAPRRRPGSNRDEPRRTASSDRPARTSRSRTAQDGSGGRERPVQMAQAENAGTVLPAVRQAQPPAATAREPDRQVQPTEQQQRSSSSLASAAQSSTPEPQRQPQPTADLQPSPPPPTTGTAVASSIPGPSTSASASNPSDQPASAAAAPAREQPSAALVARVEPPASSQPAPPPATEQPVGLSDIAALVAALPADERANPSTNAPSTPARVPARTAARESRPAPRTATPPPARPRTAQPAHPSRHWVQIAGGANAAALPAELARLRARAPELSRRNAWVTPANATNRLLVGPFASPAEAQEFVNTLATREVPSFAWTSPAGQEISRLQAGR